MIWRTQKKGIWPSLGNWWLLRPEGWVKLQTGWYWRRLVQTSENRICKSQSGEAELGAPPGVQHDCCTMCGPLSQVCIPGTCWSLDQLSTSSHTGGPALHPGDLSSPGPEEYHQAFWVEPVTCLNQKNALEVMLIMKELPCRFQCPSLDQPAKKLSLVSIHNLWPARNYSTILLHANLSQTF